MPSKNPEIKKAYKDGMITKGQYDKLSDGLLLGIIKKKKSTSKSKSKGKNQKAQGRWVRLREAGLKNPIFSQSR